jgi:dTDP-4-dehydrorhamnose reductase
MEKVIAFPKVLIIGENSLIGSTLSNYAKNDFNLYYTYHKTKTNNKNSIQIDLVKESQKILDLINKIKPSLVIHTVAYPNVDFCEKNKNDASFLHVTITEKIAQTCASIGAKILYFSTDAVFDGKQDGKYVESDLTNPLSYYGQTKLAAEKILMDISKNNVIFRTTVIYGPYSRSRFTTWVLNNLKQNKTVPAFTDQFNTPTLVDDLCKAILHIPELDLSGIYHAVGRTCLSRYDFALKLARKFNYDEKLIIPTISSKVKQVAPRPRNGCLDVTKLEKILCFEFNSIDSGIDFMKNSL